MRHLPKQSFKIMPWKNGGGETTEIMTWPEGAGLADFEWRISMARVAGDGPFSSFPDIDRILAVLEGEGMDLSVQGCPQQHLTPDSPAYAFAGDVPTSATLSKGPITDLNVMVRRGRWQAMVMRIDVGVAEDVDVAAETLILLVQSGTLKCRAGHEAVTVAAGDAVLLGQGDARVELVPEGQCVVWRIDLAKTLQI